MEGITNKGFKVLLGRGLLGGAVSGFVLVFGLLNPVTIGRSWYFWFPIAYLFFVLPLGLFTGAITGISIWLIHLNTTAGLGPFMRAGIGALICLVFWGFYFWLRDGTYPSLGSWQRYFAAVLLFGAVTGVVTGLIVGSPGGKESASRRKEPDAAFAKTELKPASITGEGN